MRETMVVIGSRSKASSPLVLLTWNKVWMCSGVVLVSLYLISILALWKATENTAPTTRIRRIGDGGSENRVPAASSPNDYAANKNDDNKHVIGYAVSITGCGSDPLTEGAAVLKHSIHMAHGKTNKYGYQMYAIVHPTALSCAKPLEQLGFIILQRQVFVRVADIEGDFLRSKIESNGCCGEKELIKLEAYTLTQHPVVVHLDLDVLVLQPLDELYDFMLASPTRLTPLPSFQWPDRPVPGAVNAFFTMDYNMVNPTAKYKPVQGGFLVLRPDQAVYEEFRQIVQKGDFREGKGWGGVVGPFYGSMTFQGLIPYYYNYLHPGQSIELNRCIYNQMCDNPRTGKTVNDVVSGKCRTGVDECEDCRNRSVEEVVTTHYTLCQKPWWCVPHGQDQIQHRLCRRLVHAWYTVRSDLERSWGRSGTGPGTYDKEQFLGYCNSAMKKGYIPITEPYGTVATY